jgi:MFS family permease
MDRDPMPDPTEHVPAEQSGPGGDDESGPVEGAFASLHIRHYRRLWLTGLASFGAVPIEAVARGYLAFELTGRNSALGLVLLGLGVPMLLMTPVGGVVADRFSKRTVLFVANALLWTSSTGIATVLVLDQLQLWMLVLSAVLQGTAFSLLGPTRMAFSFELVGRERLSNAILLAQLSMNGSRVVGPSLAGAMLGVPVLGARAVYLFTATVLTAGLLITLTLPPGTPAAGKPKLSPFADMVEGLAYVRREPPVLWPVVMSIVVIGTAFPYVAFLPALVDDVFDVGPGWLGALSTAGALGAVAASLTIARRGVASLGDWTVSLSAAAFGAFVALLGLAPQVWIALGVVVFTGAASAAFQALNNSLVLLRASERYHGRVQSLLMLGFSAFGIFAAPLGALADAIGLRSTLVAMGTASIVAVVFLHRLIVTAAAATAAADASDLDATERPVFLD